MSLAGEEREEKPRIILHVDFDYFFAQCEELRNPSLKGKPVVVCVYSARGGDSGAVSTASYKARGYGVKSGMPIKLAKGKLGDVQDAVFLGVDHEYYEGISEKAMKVLRRHADRFELLGVDEAFMDVSKRVDYDFGKAWELALRVKQDLRDEVGITCSIGIAPNKLLAKIASDFHKPDGLTVVEPSHVKSFLANLPVGRIVGVGKKTEERLKETGIRTISDLSRLDIYTLSSEFGRKIGAYLYTASRGIDEEPVVESEAVTQFSRITTLKKSSTKASEMLDDLRSLCSDLHEAVIGEGFAFKSVGIMLVLDDLSMKSKSRSLKSPSTSLSELLRISQTLLEEAIEEIEIPVRRLGVKVSVLISSKGQDTLFKFISSDEGA